jgi:hypothetical protein
LALPPVARPEIDESSPRVTLPTTGVLPPKPAAGEPIAFFNAGKDYGVKVRPGGDYEFKVQGGVKGGAFDAKPENKAPLPYIFDAAIEASHANQSARLKMNLNLSKGELENAGMMVRGETVHDGKKITALAEADIQQAYKVQVDSEDQKSRLKNSIAVTGRGIADPPVVTIERKNQKGLSVKVGTDLTAEIGKRWDIRTKKHEGHVETSVGVDIQKKTITGKVGGGFKW